MCNSTFFSRALLAALIVAVGAQSSHALNVYGIADETVGGNFVQSLVKWDSATPNSIASSTAIAGLQAGDKIVAIDFDFSYNIGNQRMFAYALTGGGTQLNAYYLNPFTATATILPASSESNFVSGAFFGMDSAGDWNTIYTNTGRKYLGARGQNLTFADGLAAYAADDPNVGKTPAIAHYLRDFSGLNSVGNGAHGIDVELDTIVRIVGGEVRTIAPLGADFDGLGGIDIYHNTGEAFAALQPAGQTASVFYSYDIDSASITPIGPIGGKLISAMAIEPALRPIPEPCAAALAAFGCVALAQFRSRRGAIARR